MATRNFFIQAGMLGLIVVSLTACGGGEATENTAPSVEKINGITVPPAPDAAKNNATIEGIDVNNNGVRDDVERVIASKVQSQEEFLTTLKIARAYQDKITKKITSRTDALKIEGAIACVDEPNSVKDLDYQALVFNTREREWAETDYLNVLRGGYAGGELPSCE